MDKLLTFPVFVLICFVFSGHFTVNVIEKNRLLCLKLKGITFSSHAVNGMK